MRATSISQVSIHAPARRATRPGRTNLRASVSIHAPARGATIPIGAYRCRNSGFNPRPRAGGDRPRLAAMRPYHMFQSTPPRGGRPRPEPSEPIVKTRFNPRPRAGGDRTLAFVLSTCRDVSIHAPARGATIPRCPPRSVDRCFNPRPRAGGDDNVSALRRRTMFQSTPPRGGRLLILANGNRFESCFNPRPRAGGD